MWQRAADGAALSRPQASGPAARRRRNALRYWIGPGRIAAGRAPPGEIAGAMLMAARWDCQSAW